MKKPFEGGAGMVPLRRRGERNRAFFASLGQKMRVFESKSRSILFFHPKAFAEYGH
jgi:hypothetical protein